MWATAERQMLVRAAFRIELIRVLKHLRVPVGSSDTQVNVGASGHRFTVKRHIFRGQAIAKLIGAFQPQHLVNRCGPKIWVGDQGGAQSGIPGDQGQPTADQICRRLMACVQNENTILIQFLSRQRITPLPLQQPCQNIGFGITRMQPAVSNDVLQQGHEIGDSGIPLGLLFRCQHRLQRTKNGQRPIPKRRALFVRDIKQIANHTDRDRRRKIRDQINVIQLCKIIQQPIHQRHYRRAQICQRTRAHRANHDGAHAGVQWRVVENQ